MLRRYTISTLCPYTTLFRSTIVHRFLRSAAAMREAVARQRLSRPFTAIVCFSIDSADPTLCFGTRVAVRVGEMQDRKSTRLNSSHGSISYAVFCLIKKKHTH